MRKLAGLFFLLLSFSGCVSVSTLPPAVPVQVKPAQADPFKGIVLGMGHATVAGLLDGEVTVGFEVDPQTGAFRPIREKTLVSSEVLEIRGQVYQIDMYLPRMSSEQLLDPSQAAAKSYPLIFRDGVLVGKGDADLQGFRIRAAADYAQ
jgi:tetrahydromethanopterin S-methyltransferase subunit B